MLANLEFTFLLSWSLLDIGNEQGQIKCDWNQWTFLNELI